MYRQMSRRPGMQCFGDEIVAGDVVAGVETVEIPLHLLEFFGAVNRQRFQAFIRRPPLALGGDPIGEIGTGREGFCTLSD